MPREPASALQRKPESLANAWKPKGGIASLAALLLLLLLHPLPLAAAQQQQQATGSTLHMNEVFISSSAAGKAVFAPDITLGGEPLAVVTAQDEHGCAQACRQEDACSWFNYCEAQEGCTLPGNEALLDYQGCMLFDGNCTLIPPVAARGTQGHVTAGFPLLFPDTPDPAVAIKYEAQGMVGGDFECSGTLIPGMCAISGLVVALPTCINSFAGTCTAVVVYSRGMDGCSEEIAVLKQTRLVPSNSFMSPTVYTLEVEERGPTGSYLLYDEGIIVGASEASSTSPTAAAPSAGGAIASNVTTDATWLGCILATMPAVMNGDILTTLDGIASPEACCRECRARAPNCTVWNGCFNSEEICRYKDQSQEIVLRPGQCELRKQELASPERGGPPWVLAKGDAAGGFTAGVPLSARPGPELPGYTRYIASGLFGQPGYKCNSTIQVVLQECILRGTPQQLADNCTQDSRCVAWIWKDLFWRESPGAGALRGKEGADISRMLRTSATTIYFKQAAIGAAGTSAPSSSSDGDDGLAGGAIAGIVIGCAAAAVAAALGGWALLHRRQQQQGSSVRTVAPVASAVSGKTVKEGGDLLALPMPPSTDSWQDRQLSGQRSVLGSPQASSVTASPAAAAASVGASSHSEAGGAAPAGPPRPGRLPSSGSGSVILGRAVIGRPVAPSPFAAARQLRLTGPGSAVSHSSSAAGGGSVHASVDRSFSSPPMSMGLSSMGFPSPPARSEWASSAAQSGCAERTPSASAGAGAERKPEVQVELPQVLPELMQQRAAEEQACLVPALSITTSPPGEGGISLPTSGSSISPSGSPLPSATLPASLLSWVIPRGEVEYQRRPDGELAVLGEGASGRVIRAMYNGEMVAAKEMEIGRGIEVQEVFLSEAKHMQALRHPNIVTFYGCVLDGPKGILLMELMDGRDLGSVLRLRNAQGQRVFGWYKHGCRVAWEVAKALNYLHARNFVHMDVKASNVLLTCGGQAKLGDVGLARLQTKTCLSDLPRLVGTFAWVAPEVLMGGRNCTNAIDMYSYGVLLWELITGERPVRGHLRAPLVPDECPQEAADLMAECGAINPAERPTAQQCLRRLQAMLAAQQQGQG